MRISIALATYNGGKYLREQLDSLAAQTVLPHELQVGDDGSDDSTLSVLADFARNAPFSVTIHSNGRHLGFGGNFMETASRCTGDWIAFCDQDDIWKTGKLAEAAHEIANGPADLALFVHNALIADEHLRSGRKLYEYPAHSVTPPLGLPPEWYCIGATQVFRSDLIKVIPWDRRPSFPWHSHRDAHDVWIALLGNIMGSVVRSDRTLMLYRRHSGTVTDQAKAKARPNLLRFQGESYSQRSAYLHDVAGLLSDLAGVTAEPYSTRLSEASFAFTRHAEMLKERSTAQSAPEFKQRLMALRAAVRSGAYRSDYRWNFGKARLGKDLLGILLSSLFSTDKGALSQLDTGRH